MNISKMLWYLEEWRIYVDKNGEALQQNLKLTDDLLGELKRHQVLTICEYENLMAVNAAELRVRAMKFIDILFYDNAFLKLQDMIRIFQKHGRHVVAEVMKIFAHDHFVLPEPSHIRELILMSSSDLPTSGYLEYAREFLSDFWNKNNVKEITFVPYANVEDQKKYTDSFRNAVTPWGFTAKGLNEVEDPIIAVNEAQCLFVGGGNTFLLLKSLQDKGLVDVIRRRVLREGMPYVGSSAGTNVATTSINTTNDMPIIQVDSFMALGLVPFNINPHYLDPDPNSTHQGIPMEKRIAEFHCVQQTVPVLGLRDGSYLLVTGQYAKLGGLYPARLFIRNKDTQEIPVGADLGFLLDPALYQ